VTPSFILRTRYGVAIYTTDDRRKALAEAMRQRDDFPGCYLVEQVIPPPVERKIWTDRQSRQATDAKVIPMRRAVS
jgi:hypothetical protein